MTEQKRLIHIRGIGQAAQVPDVVTLSLTLTARNAEYSAAMTVGSQQVELLRESIVAAGFKANDLKTINFDVRAVYEDEEYREGNSKRRSQIFVGFECRHDLKLAFDFDNARLNRALDTIAACLSQPKVSVAFTIKDTEDFNDKLLKAAAKDAKHKAKILCAASGVKLGQLLDINYSPEVLEAQATIVCGACAPVEKNAFDLQPDELTASLCADFLWEIE